MRMVKVKILDAELEAALLNPNVMRKFNEGIKDIARKAKEASKISVGADAIESQCNVVIDFIDSMFGAGSARKVFGEETDLLTCLDAYKDLTELYNMQINPMLKEYSEKILLEISGESRELEA